MTTQTIRKFWVRWMLVATAVVLLFGDVLLFTPGTAVNIFNYLFFGTTDTASMYDAAAIEYFIFLYSILGAVTIGWMIPVFYVILTGFRRGERSAWITLVLSFVGWYVLDSGASILTGFGMNAVSNTGLLILFVIPLAATYRQFFAAPQSAPQKSYASS